MGPAHGAAQRQPLSGIANMALGGIVPAEDMETLAAQGVGHLVEELDGGLLARRVLNDVAVAPAAPVTRTFFTLSRRASGRALRRWRGSGLCRPG